MTSKYVSVDIETTGLNSEKCQILEVGAVIEDWKTPIDQLPKFHCFVLHREGIRGEPYALQLNSEILRFIADYKKHRNVDFFHPDEVVHRLTAFLQRYFGSEKVTFAGKNFGSFDLQFLRRLPGFDVHMDSIARSYRYIDPAMLYWNPEIDGNEIPNLQKCVERAGFTNQVRNRMINVLKEHRAIDDAKTVIQIIRQYYRSQDV